MLVNCIMCKEPNIHWFCSKCEKRYSIHHPAVMAKMDRYRLKLKLEKEFS
jgi:transcription elongation factor Elf1